MDSYSLDLRRYSHLRQRTAIELDAWYIATASIDKNNPAVVVSISPNVGGCEIVSHSSLFSWSRPATIHQLAVRGI